MVVFVRPTVLELGLYRDDYEAFVEGLRAEGLDARLDEPVEQRSGVSHAALDAGVWLLQEGADAVIDLVVLEALRRVWRATVGRPKGGRSEQQVRRVAILNGRGEVLEWVELPAESADD